MQNFTFRATSKAISLLEKVIKARIIVQGVEHIPPNPCLFVVNHFTRLETFLVPYVLHKHKGMIVHSLASSILFKGLFGTYLSATGAMPTEQKNRDHMIVHDLITGDTNWVIYPEGVMVKNKDVFKKGRYRLNAPTNQGSPHTGAAVLALRAEIAKHCHELNKDHGYTMTEETHSELYGVGHETPISPLSTMLVPVTITYYPLRPGENFISDIAGLFFKELPKRLEEELQTEGKILLSDSDINIYFGEPINIADEIKAGLHIFNKYLPFIGKSLRDDLILAFKRKKITQHAMSIIYTNTAVNIDHLFCTALRKSKQTRIHRQDFVRALFLSAIEIERMEKRRTHPLLRRDLIKCIADEDYGPLDSICILTEKVGALRRDGEYYEIHKKHILGEDFPFHDIRLKNAAVVIANELEPLKNVVDAITDNINLPPDNMKHRLAKTLHEKNLIDFKKDYIKYYNEELSKPEEIGQPIFLKSKNSKNGIILAHGYMAAPTEMRPLAEYLHNHGYTVYVPCLKGMGTAPRQLNETTWMDWMYSFDKAYAVIRNTCDNVYAGGFSMGGLLALLSAARKHDAIKGLFCINTPILLRNVKNKLVPSAVSWNEFMDVLRLEQGKVEYIENVSESPDINYSRNYVRGVLELNHLIRTCRKSLHEVTSPALIIQGTNDPVVKPESGDIIHAEIKSSNKVLVKMDRDRHIIVRQDGHNEVMLCISSFLNGLAPSS